VHRTFIGFEVEGEPPQPGTKIRTNDKDMGEITSAARVPIRGGERTIAVGYLRREVGAPGTVVQIGEQSATVHNLPFEF
jgi:aminomethyltransferase